jgi:excisionase family DNA binding protein
MDKLLTVKEAAEFLSIYPQNLYKLIAKRQIPFIKKLGIGYRIRPSDLKRWMEEGSSHYPIIGEILPKFDISLDGYDKLFLERRTELKGSIRWSYPFGSVLMRKTKKGEEKYYIDYQVDSYRVRKVVKGARTRAEAVKVLNAEVADAMRGQYPFNRASIGFFEMCELFLEKYSKPKKKSWKKADRVYIRNLKEFFGDIKLAKITPLSIEEYKIKRLKVGVKKKGAKKKKLENSSLNRELSCLRKIFNKAIDWGYAVENPMKKVDFLPEDESYRKRILSEDEEVRLLESAESYLKPLLLVALYTGMRKGEIFNLKWQDVDFEKREITVTKSKSGKQRRIPINTVLFNLLYAHKVQNGKSEYVFTNPKTGKPYSDIKKSFSSALEEAGIEDFHFHDLRHTFASRLVRNGVDLNTVKELMGHYSITTTQRYLHSQAKEKMHAVESLAGQKKENVLQWQKSVKSVAADDEVDLITSSFSGSYEDVKGVH